MTMELLGARTGSIIFDGPHLILVVEVIQFLQNSLEYRRSVPVIGCLFSLTDVIARALVAVSPAWTYTSSQHTCKIWATISTHFSPSQAHHIAGDHIGHRRISSPLIFLPGHHPKPIEPTKCISHGSPHLLSMAIGTTFFWFGSWGSIQKNLITSRW